MAEKPDKGKQRGRPEGWDGRDVLSKLVDQPRPQRTPSSQPKSSMQQHSLNFLKDTTSPSFTALSSGSARPSVWPPRQSQTRVDDFREDFSSTSDSSDVESITGSSGTDIDEGHAPGLRLYGNRITSSRGDSSSRCVQSLSSDFKDFNININREYDSSRAFLQSRSLDEDLHDRATPESLGWSPDSDLVDLYKLVMPRQLVMPREQEYFLELLDDSKASIETPLKVYLDVKRTKGRSFTCFWPGKCSRKVEPFIRRADLERHLNNVHGQRTLWDHFCCPYNPCPNDRHLKKFAFTRKDHLRDHVRDFHQEDIGSAKGERNARTKEERRQWQKKQEYWVASRKISADWWTCAKCVVRQYVERDGWTCTFCNTPCETQRKEARLRLLEKQGSRAGQDQAQASTSNSSARLESSGEGDQTSMTICICYGSEWVDNGYGALDPCPYCNYPTTESSFM
ncbi:hypothetical protein BKA64DRAFT_673900 [Cadophora sp. MPI-SDFR-AT-0126]|nr:hypothetical protein BKA64DRAFT_673900 [Leotiomycetes sp. MPI-SDFR-AT-0126]